MSQGVHLFVLNTVLYSSKLIATDNTTTPTPEAMLPDDPLEQFSWLETQLTITRARKELYEEHIM